MFVFWVTLYLKFDWMDDPISWLFTSYIERIKILPADKSTATVITKATGYDTKIAGL